MTCLPDINVWLALTVAEHVHHAAAMAWYPAGRFDRLAWVRVTQMGFLRLLTNSAVMKQDVLAPEPAWQLWDGWMRQARVFFAEEPPDLATHWRKALANRRAGTSFWTDAYLAAFAEAAGFRLVTFDRELAGIQGFPVDLLR